MNIKKLMSRAVIIFFTLSASTFILYVLESSNVKITISLLIAAIPLVFYVAYSSLKDYKSFFLEKTIDRNQEIVIPGVSLVQASVHAQIQCFLPHDDYQEDENEGLIEELDVRLIDLFIPKKQTILLFTKNAWDEYLPPESTFTDYQYMYSNPIEACH